MYLLLFALGIAGIALILLFMGSVIGQGVGEGIKNAGWLYLVCAVILALVSQVIEWRRVGLLVLLVILPSVAHAQTSALITANVLDVASTEYAISHGAVEMNPIMGQTTAQRVVVKGLSTAAQVWLVKRLSPRHPKLAKGLGYGLSALLVGVAGHNLRVGQQMQRGPR